VAADGTGSQRGAEALRAVRADPPDIIREVLFEALYLRKRPRPVGILNDFERRLEGTIEGIFAKAFRSGLHPVELATRILKEMEAGKTVGVRGVWVPNHYVFGLSPPDTERFSDTQKALRRELESVVADGARERGWGLVGPPEVEFEEDEGLKQGRFTCEASLVEGPNGWAPPVEPAAAPAAGSAPTAGNAAGATGVAAAPDGAASGPASLTLLRGGTAAQRFTLQKERTVVGRLPECDVVVDDPGASRHHAEIRRVGGSYVVSDLGSTNGTLVNDAAVGEQALADGDRITIGNTVLEFRRG
jgi:hypothetical protein